ncbi:MAG: endonuclease/exonuclease/phosphatase family protein [Mariniphaga sp.]|nr:endonuclease/exonuclease/phosphatase family protein [Mariniphaga sp.]
MKHFKHFFKLIISIIILCACYLGGVILYGTLTDYKPKEKIDLEIKGTGNVQSGLSDTLTFLSWNIGFCGLGAEMDFFYDGGEMVRPTKELVEKYTTGVIEFLQKYNQTDFIILQEVDENSARTRRQNEVEIISSAMQAYNYSYDDNYNVKFVPVPFTNPLGKVEAGQMNLSKVEPASSERVAFHSAYAWPKRLFMLDRCFIVSRFNTDNGKQLVLLNTHNSAYDSGGKLRTMEMPVIRDLMIEEFNKGNYVVAGGDWNQNPPDYDLEEVNKTYPAVTREKLDGTLFPSGWSIVYDQETPTNREIDTPLQKGKTTSTIIDYYIVSPNVEALEIETINVDFQYSDHQPVFLKIRLIN